MQQSPDTLYPENRAPTNRAWRNDVYEELILSGMDKVAKRWLSCSDTFKTRLKPAPDVKLPQTAEKVFVCSADHTHDMEIYSQSCDLRFCPDCARMHSARLVARFLPKCEELLHHHHHSYTFRHIVFTTPFSLTEPDIRKKLQLGFRQVWKALDGLMSKKGAWKHKQGFFVSSEFGEQGLKLHYHVLHYGKYLKQSDLSREWSAATCGVASVVFVRGLHKKGKTIENSVREVLKYATKFYSQNKITGEITYIAPALMPVLAKAVDKTRRVRAYGVFYNLPEPDRSEHLCDTCKSPMVGIPLAYYEIYCNTGFLPLDWQHARNEDSLNSRTADKSSALTSGLAPPDREKEAWHQKDLPFLTRIRNQSYD